MAVEILKVRDADIEGYNRIVLADPIGAAGAGAEVTAEYEDGATYSIILHGQKEFDFPGEPTRVVFPGGQYVPGWAPE